MHSWRRPGPQWNLLARESRIVQPGAGRPVLRCRFWSSRIRLDRMIWIRIRAFWAEMMSQGNHWRIAERTLHCQKKHRLDESQHPL